VTSYALVPELGNVTWAESTPNFLGLPTPPSRPYSEETAREIDRAVRTIVESAFHKATGILNRERDQLDRGAQLLLQKETLSEEDLRPFRDAAAGGPA
jgi:cell division protease FtsH